VLSRQKYETENIRVIKRGREVKDFLHDALLHDQSGDQIRTELGLNIQKFSLSRNWIFLQ